MAKSISVGCHPARGKLCFGSIICLIALLAQLYFPLVHQCEHILEGFIASAALGAEQGVTLRIEDAESEEGEHHSHHDEATCPICQAALSCRYFAVITLSLAPALSMPVQHFCNNCITSIVADPDILVLGPRAPPVSL